MREDFLDFGDVPEFPSGQPGGDRRWLVLFEEDCENHTVDVDGNVGVLIDIEQAGEIIQVAAQALADLSHQDADGDDVIRNLVDALEQALDDGDGERDQEGSS